MSAFAVPIKRIRAIEPHPNADAIEFAVVEGYRSIVKKGEFRTGDLVVYIPEASLLPEWLLRRLGFWDADKGRGRLNGRDGNRVKAIRLRGELSQGICYALAPDTTGAGRLRVEPDETHAWPIVREGDDVAALLGIVKYDPPIPADLAGEVFDAGARLTVNFDVENWKSYPDILREGEGVVFTEKLHGTFTGVAVLPPQDAHPDAFGRDRNILVFSKGLGAKGLVLRNNAQNANNLYVRATRKLVDAIDARAWNNDVPVILMGETFGPGVQDLVYGEELGFRLFACAEGYRGEQRYHDFDRLAALADELGVEIVPVLYRGPFNASAMNQYTDGRTTLGAAHMREGIVMTPEAERTDPRIGRVCLKSVSADYLTRKGGTEYN